MARFTLSLTLIAAIVVASSGCKDSPPPTEPPTGGSAEWSQNMLANGSFNTSITGTTDITVDNVVPWESGTNTPQICPGTGCGSTGFLQMWGNADVGETTYEPLQHPILKGHTYRITACVKFFDDNPANYTRHVKARFLAINQVPTETSRLWTPMPGEVTVIGSIKTSDTAWATVTTDVWVADADYAGFAIDAENETKDDGTPTTVSWIRIDNVQLQEKNMAY